VRDQYDYKSVKQEGRLYEFLLSSSTSYALHSSKSLFFHSFVSRVFYRAALKYCVMGKHTPLQMYYSGTASAPLVKAPEYLFGETKRR
jgi:Zn-dependent M32 family carboxypeptidase